MISITEKTLQDLQFPTVLETISTICNKTLEGKALEITPFKDKDTLMRFVANLRICFVFPK
jgi:DNA mismatch repair protein MutS2